MHAPSRPSLTRAVLEERCPAAAPVGHQGTAFFIPDDGAIHDVDERGASTGDFLVGGAVTQAPGIVDASVGAADGAGIAQAEARGDLLVGEALRHQLDDTQLVWLQQRPW